MKMYPLVIILFGMCAMRSLISMEPDVKKAKFFINNDKRIVEYLIWGSKVQKGKYDSPVPFRDMVKLDEQSYTSFCFGCSDSEKNMVKIKALLDSVENKPYLITMRPILTKNPLDKHFIVEVKPYELCITKL